MFSIQAGYREAMAFQIYSVVGLLVVPFAVLSLIKGDYWLSVPPLAATGLSLVNVYSYWRHRQLWVSPLIISLLYITICLLVIVKLGTVGAYWSFPTMLAIYWVHSRRVALHAVSILIVGVVAAAAMTMPMDASVRLVATLLMTAIFFTIASAVLEKQYAALKHLTVTDHLTGAFNRRFMDSKIDELIEMHRRSGIVSSILTLDVDYFKKVNDCYGHSMGDKILVELVRVLKRRVRSIDSVCRAGGEEFVVLVQDTSEAQARQLGEELRATINESALLRQVAITISCGVGEVLPGDTRDTWLQRCDQALYRAKERGRNKVESCQPDFGPGHFSEAVAKSSLGV